VLPISKVLQIWDFERAGDRRAILEVAASFALQMWEGLHAEAEVLGRNALASVLSIRHVATGRRIDKSDEGAVN